MFTQMHCDQIDGFSFSHSSWWLAHAGEDSSGHSREACISVGLAGTKNM